MNLSRLLLLTSLLLSLSGGWVRAQQDASSAFFSAYQEYQRAERLEREGRNQDAIAKFRYVATQLGQIKANNPDWQPLVLDFRLRKTQEAIVRLEGALDSPVLGPPPDLAVVQDDEMLPPVRPPRRDVPQGGPTISIMPDGQESAPVSPPRRSSVTAPAGPIAGDAETLRRQVAAERQRTAELEKQLQRGEADLLSVSMELEKTKVAVVDLTTQLRQFKEGGMPAAADAAETESLRATAAELEAALAAAKADKDQLEARAAESVQQVEELNAKLKAAEEAVSAAAESKTEAEKARAAEEAAKAEATAAKAEAETAKGETEAAKQSAEAAKKDIDAARKQLSEAEAALKKAEDAAAKAKPEVLESAKREVEAALREIKDLTLNLAELERERAELIASRDVAQRRFVEARGGGDKSAELIEANRQLEARLSEATRQLARMERDTTVKDLTQRVAELEKERSELMASRDVAQQQVAEAKEAVEKSNALIEANRELGEKLAEAQASGADSGDSVKDLTQRVAELEKERSELMASRDVSQQQLAEAKEAADKTASLLETNRELEAKLATAVEQAAKADNSGAVRELTEKVAGLEKERADLQAAREAIEADLATAKSAADTASALAEANRQLEEKLAAANEQASAASRAEIEGLNQKIAELEKERADLTASRDAAQEELAAAKSAPDANTELIEAKRQLEEKLAAATEQISGLQTDAAAKGEVITGLQNDLESVRTQLADAQTKLKDDRERFDKLQAINDQLLKEYDQVTGALAAVKLGDVTAAEAKLLQQENEVLRGIVMRQVKEQARREQVFRLAQEELQRLEVNSGTLEEKISELAQPTLELTAAEQEMLQRPVITLLDADAAKMTAQVEVLKPQAPAEPGAAATPAPTADRPADEQPPSESAAAAASLSTELSREMQAVLGQARDEFVKGNFAKAEELYLKFVEQHPDNIVALANLGVAQFRQGKLTAAQLALERAVKADPNDAFSLTTLGAVMIEQGRIEDAISYLERSNASVADDPITLNYLGVASSQLGQFGKAEQSLRRAITVKPDYAEAHFNLAVIYATAKPPSIALAKRHYEKALELGASPDKRLAAMLQDASGS